MHSYKPSGTNFKRVCADLPNIALLNKSATPGDIQINFGHTSVGNNPPGETVTTFALAGSLESLTVVSMDFECAFTSNG